MNTLFADSLDNRGYLAQPVVDPDQFLENMPRVVSLQQAAEKIGSLIAPSQFTYFGGSLRAPLLDVPPEAFTSVLPPEVATRLYIPRPREAIGVKQAVSIFKGKADFNLPGMAHPRTGLVFDAHDYKQIPRSSFGLADNAGATTRNANPIEANSDDREESDRKDGSAHAKSVAGRILSSDKLAISTAHTRDIFRQVYRGVRADPPVRYRPENAFALLMSADTELRKIVEISGFNQRVPNPDNPHQAKYAPLPPELRSANQRALTVNLYQRGETAHIWRVYMRLAGFYANAQLVKISEARNAGVPIYEEYREHIKDEELPEFDTIVYGLPNLLELKKAA